MDNKEIKNDKNIGFTLDQLFELVDKLEKKSSRDESAKKVLDTADEKWHNPRRYAF